MSRVFFGVATALALATTALAAPASATTYVYVGSWQLDEGPSWTSSPPDGPLAYTGQEAAAFLFGGPASKYVISTAGPSTSTIDQMAWYSVIGYDVVKHAQDYSSKYLGQYYGPTSNYPFGDPNAAASAYVNDIGSGSQYTNYAFAVAGVPEPAAWGLMILGFGVVGGAMRRRQRVSVRFA